VIVQATPIAVPHPGPAAFDAAGQTTDEATQAASLNQCGNGGSFSHQHLILPLESFMQRKRPSPKESVSLIGLLFIYT
jgi:hypothetical protein